jgi:2-keto-4-pentenoate hydratase/2-oxohepta-3-ene-1,7-dioic acid hydratase in catechol pathway
MRRVPEEKALSYVLGYTCALDLTARDVQKTDLQWIRAKSADGFCPLGPWIETELDPSDLALRTFVNGEIRQNSRTSRMIFSIPFLLSYITRFMTLEPGDVLLTGTPEGVGELRVGDEVAVEIEGIGRLSVRIVPSE